MSASSSEQRRAGETEKRTLTANKTCVPCRARKVKCDAAMTGLPCSSCTSRQCAKDCVLPVRLPATPRSSQLENLNQFNQPENSSTSDSLDCRTPHQAEPDLLYLKILNDAVRETSESSRHDTTSDTCYRSRPEDNITPRNCWWTKLSQLDDIDNEYLVKKGVFDLPLQHHFLIKTYFDHVYPFAPMISRADFICGYQSGNCSLFLLYVILTPASLHAPADVLSACGFASRSAAQESFFSKAKLLHDFAAEEDPLLMLQGSIILCMVILDHPTDRDFGYWFHNAIRLATKLDLRDTCVREDKPRKVIKLYRRIWWTLYFLDIFYVFLNTRRLRLLENTPAIKPCTVDDLELEDVSGASSGLLLAVTPQEKASPVVHCELSRIFGQGFYIVTNKPQEDPRQIMHPLDAWRKSLATKMHVGGNIGIDVYYLNIQAMSYRFECILCRLIRRGLQQSQHADWREWAKGRLRSAMLELDTISMRVLASGTLQNFPIPFVTTITALLALRIESALDPAETDLVHSMARISISQTMLLLTQGKEIPAVKRALPVFEEILARKNLYLVPPGQVPAQSQSQDNSRVDAYTLPNTQVNRVPSRLEQGESNLLLYGDVLGFDFLDDWRLGSWSSVFDVDVGSQERAE
ncbi:Fusaric acid cluster transcription factor [Hyphodiscus hymeniophilus]|uniref:Fusaric acid cluster transcription factor n=1 Tax=Hyphodiscus hymeniophilus TaxID=353542 RepID=A0A9P6SJH6_9HELO|nr:Fusaric acid cluster transcription factor [Hyphodiscus hymeniophilus]